MDDLRRNVARAICCPNGCQERGEYDPIKGSVGICQSHTFDAETDAVCVIIRAAVEAERALLTEVLEDIGEEAEGTPGFFAEYVRKTVKRQLEAAAIRARRTE